jgi:hypothetical protein
VNHRSVFSSIRTARFCLLGVALAIFSCTDSGLQVIVDSDIQVYDDQLEITGQFCTSPADETAFPVKILIVLDQSASLQCTDATNARFEALNRAGSELDALPNVMFGVVGFASWTSLQPFTGSWNEAYTLLTRDSGGPATDYQGAFSTTVKILEQDMRDSGPAEVARTKYVVLFMSDGIPEPRCNAGCDDGDTIPDSLYGVCNTSEEVPDDVYVDMMSECPDYNQPEQIRKKVNDIMELGTFYGAGALNIYTVFLFAPQADVEAVCGNVDELFGYNREEAEPLLREISDIGLGTFRDVNTSDEIDFLDFDYESLVTPYELKEFFAVNISTLPGKDGVLPDSDKDGLDDETEDELGLNSRKADTDGDNYNDRLEYELARKSGNNNYDPMNPKVPADPNGTSEHACKGDRASDSDGDGLRNCEEDALGTDPYGIDSDGDRMPDGIEFRLGTDPLRNDTLVDHDFDGRMSGKEIKTGFSPITLEAENAFSHELITHVDQGKIGQDETRCYDFDIKRMTLFQTRFIEDESKVGTNRILIFASEEPVHSAGAQNRYYVACVEAQYWKEKYKIPTDGLINDLISERFVELQLFDPAVHCLETGDDPGRLLDGGLP